MKYQKYEKVLQRYEIIKMLGKGSFGEVYLARHLELDVFRAIKVLHRDMPGVTDVIFNSFQKRFRLEATFGAKIENSNIIRVYDFASDNGKLYLVMEYAPNGDLANFIQSRISENKLISIETVLRILRDIAAGLAGIHQLDGVHRDLKPSNILFDKDHRAKVADLGIIQTANNQAIEMDVAIFGHPGTPIYMSPEQLGSKKLLTPTSDVYSLGLIAFEILTLKKKQGVPNSVQINQLRHDVEPWFESAINTMLEVVPEKRPRNGQEVLDILSPSVPLIKPHENQANYSEIHLPYGLKIQMVKVPAGPFTMGVDNNLVDSTEDPSPAHQVFLPDFWIGRFPISLAQFAAFVRRTGYVSTAEREGEGFVYDHSADNFVKVRGASWVAPYGPYRIIYMDPNRPVTMVSWQDTIVFCEWLNSVTGLKFRLPTEAEWEKAARGTDARMWPWGNRPPTPALCNFVLQKNDITASDKYSPMGDSPYGCGDMMGNIWEWTSSIPKYYPYKQGDGREVLTQPSNRVLRGGSVIHYPTVFNRDSDPENACYFNDGFRVAAQSV